MYERNAIVIDRHFSNLFGYDQNNNLKINSTNYFELVSKLEEYQIATENENNIIQEFDRVANQIRETQKLQETLNKKSLKFLENRKALFDNLDEDADMLNKKFDRIEEDLNRNDDEIKTNIEKFVDEIREFHEKTEIRTDCGRERRIIESDYQKILDKTTDNFSKINKERLKEIKAFVKSENKEPEKQKIREKIQKNGAKEKVPFDETVIKKAIDVSTDIEQKKVEILLSIYDKTGKLLEEIKNDTVKIERHKKIVRDAKSKLEYLNVISEYVILFLDNERMNLIGGEVEHERVMTETCENVQKDLSEIQNLYSLLIKEITDKSSKRAYKELYNLEYLFDLQDAEKKFEDNISKLNIRGSVVYPDYWRIEGMQKIFDTFKKLITDVYGKDLTEYEPLDIPSAINEDILKMEDEEQIESIEEEQEDNVLPGVDDEIEEELEEETEEKEESEESKEEEEDEDEDNVEDDDDVFQWDDDDINDELNFDSTPIFDDSEEEEEINLNDEEIGDEELIENTEEDGETEEESDEEIDKILGFFDEEDTEDIDDEFNLDDENFDDLDDLDDLIGDEDDDNLSDAKPTIEVDDNQIEKNEEKSKESNKSKNKKDKKKEKEKDKKKKSLFGRKK